MKPAAAAAARPLTVGFFDGVYNDSAGPMRALWLDRSRIAGARIVRIKLSWASIAPSRPQRASDPSDPAYRWSGFDASVADATARRLTVLATFTAAPHWAEGPGGGRGSGAW